MEGKETDMPVIAPKVSWQMLRNYMEKFCWTDVRTGLRTTGYNPPKGARDVMRVPFHCTFVTGNGRTQHDRRTASRDESKEKRNPSGVESL